MVVNDFQIPSGPILIGKCDYPENLLDSLRERADTTVIRAGEIAAQIGNVRGMNIVLLGALVKGMELTHVDFEAEIAKNVKPETVAMNVAAFHAGLASL